jgi:UDP-N-acetylmuramoyl-L-alanyl-D-glutamate--2,6-diaminopimelate ligase
VSGAPVRSLRGLLAGVIDVPPALDRAIAGIGQDSRTVCPGGLFLAVAGETSDGRRFIDDAIARGAAAIVFDADGYLPSEEKRVPAFPCPGLKRQIGVIAERFYGAPMASLSIIGVTGTNGKTTCTHLLARAFDAPPRRCAVVGTVGNGFPDALETSTHTTPDAVRLHALFADFVHAGAKRVCMEVSSHALEQGRVAGVAFDGAVFTNLTRDHLDYHGDMAAYGRAKASLFDMPGLRFAVINADDAFGHALAHRLEGKIEIWTYGLDGGTVRGRAVRIVPAGLEIDVETPRGNAVLRTALLGRFNASNLLAVLATLLAAGVGLADAIVRLEEARPVAGRMERFGGAMQPLVVVDYAHTPDALEKALLALREHAPARLWCVFGCGGDRDRGKRPLMGRIADRLADEVILTDDNPRTESPEAIIAEIEAGMRRPARVVRDRAAAIRLALSEAQAGEVVLVAGKGHEDYQQVGNQRIPFSDAQVVRDVLGIAA